MKSYFIMMDNEPKGPYPLQMILEMGLPDEALVRESTLQSWVSWKEIRAEILTGYEVGKTGIYAGFWQRMLSLFIDMIIILTISTGVYLIPGGTISLPLLALIAIVFGVCFELTPWQGTPGKIILGLKVTDRNMQRLKFGQVLGRNIAKIFSVITLGIGWLMIGLTRQKQGLHDRVALTFVVHRELEERKGTRGITINMIVLLAVCCLINISLCFVDAPRKTYSKTGTHFSYEGVSFTNPDQWEFTCKKYRVEKILTIHRTKGGNGLIEFCVLEKLDMDKDQLLKESYTIYEEDFKGMEIESIQDGRYNRYKTKELSFRYYELRGNMKVFDTGKKSVIVVQMLEAGKTEPGFKIIEDSFKIEN